MILGKKNLTIPSFATYFVTWCKLKVCSHKKDVKFYDGTKMSSWGLIQDEINLHKPKGGWSMQIGTKMDKDVGDTFTCLTVA